MPLRRFSRPTDAELQILRVLWERGPSTVREVKDALDRDRAEGQQTGYTTALKLMQIMTEKGLLRRDEKDRTHIYRAACSEEDTQKRLLRDLADRAFGGSAQKLVMQALAAKRTKPEELAEIRRLLDEMEGKKKGGKTS